MKITPLGDSAVTISFSSSGTGDAAELLPTVWATKKAIDKAAIPGVVETVSSYDSVTVFLDPGVPFSQGISVARVGEWFNESILAVASEFDKKRIRAKRTAETEIPVCFENEFALDLADAAAKCHLTPESMLQRFCDANYQVVCIGFTPGFPYLLGLPAELVVPRRPTPRTIVPAGSVAIGGSQAGIYPLNSPGGWNVIGRTPVKLFDPQDNPPSLLAAGDRVRFKQISRAEFEAYHSRPVEVP
jgi:KipI family sensor histidine kinase inhibitor